MLITIMILMIMFLLIGIYFLIPLFSNHSAYDREKNSPFECGFDPFSYSRISFSIHFFSFMMMFLIFDIEISILIPLPLTIYFSELKLWIFVAVVLIFVLVLGLLLEWKEGSMNWK